MAHLAFTFTGFSVLEGFINQLAGRRSDEGVVNVREHPAVLLNVVVQPRLQRAPGKARANQEAFEKELEPHSCLAHSVERLLWPPYVTVPVAILREDLDVDLVLFLEKACA